MRRVKRARTTPPAAYLVDAPPVIGFAHRGGARHQDLVGLENTAAAFRHAWKLGYTYLETDVHVTSDGLLIAFHDSMLDRVTNRTGLVSETDSSDVAQALIGGSEPVPTFASLLAEFPQARFNVDIKADAAVEPLVRVLREHNATERVLVGSFSPGRLRHFRRLAPEVVTSAHVLEVVLYRLLPSAALARWATRARPVALQVPQHYGRLCVVTPGLIRRAHRNGLAVHVWTVDDEDEMEALIARGVDGLMTDRTDILKNTLTRHGFWKDRP